MRSKPKKRKTQIPDVKIPGRGRGTSVRKVKGEPRRPAAPHGGGDPLWLEQARVAIIEYLIEMNVLGGNLDN